MIKMRCSCGQVLQAHEKHIGRQFNCPKCGSKVRVTAEEPFDQIPEEPTDDVVSGPLPPRYEAAETQPFCEPTNSSLQYPWCRKLRRAANVYGFLSFIGAAATMMGIMFLCAIVFFGNGAVRPEIWVMAVTLFLNCIILGFIFLAFAELLGGTVAYLIKHD